MPTKFPLGKARELHKMAGDFHKALDAALAEFDSEAPGNDQDPMNTPVENAQANVQRQGAQDADPLGIRRMARDRYGADVTPDDPLGLGRLRR